MMMTTTTVEPVAAVGRFLAAGVHACHRPPPTPCRSSSWSSRGRTC